MLRLAVAALSITAAIADPRDHVTSYLQMRWPQSLYKDGGYLHREALFGSPPYGGSIVQMLYYAESELCESVVDKRTGYPARETDETGQMEPWPSPFILMVDRGNCTFAQKIRNAQHAGAAAVIIADNVCLCNDIVCLNATAAETDEDYFRCETNEPIMSDDGSGGDITVPAFLMTKHDANDVKAQLYANQFVQIEMGWTLPHPDDTVEYELWTVPSEHVSDEFQSDWKTISQKFEKHIRFTPRQYIFDGESIGCSFSQNSIDLCYNQCTNQGKYCSMDPDGDPNNGISGADVVVESLRRICIWSRYGADDGIGTEYWDYIGFFMKTCDTPDYFSNKKCIKDAMKSAKIVPDTVQRCMDDSGGTERVEGNTQLEAELRAQEERGVIVLPTVFVNNAALRGALSASTTIAALCAGFAEGTKPEICDICADCPFKMQCVETGKCTGDSSGGRGSSFSKGGDENVSKRFFGTSLLVVCTIFSVGAYFQWKRSQNDMRDQVRGILSEYMPLEGGENEGVQMDQRMDFARNGGNMS